MSTIRALAITLAIWILYQILAPYAPTATVFFPVLSYVLWRRHQHQLALVVLLVGSLLLDLGLSQGTPEYLLVSVLAGAIYLEFVDPHLSSGTTLGSTIGLITWLLLFRITHLIYLTASTAFLRQPLPDLTLALSIGLKWLATGLTTWGLIQLSIGLKQRAERKRKTKLVSYA